MRSDEDLCSEYGLDPDDGQALLDARYLESACSLSGYEDISGVAEMSRIREHIDAAYLRAVSSSCRPLIGLAEQAVVFHARVSKWLKKLVQAEASSDQRIYASRCQEAMALDFLDRVRRGACAPAAIIEGIGRVVQVFDDECHPVPRNRAEAEAASSFFVELLQWSRQLLHDSIEMGHERALLRRFEPLRDLLGVPRVSPEFSLTSNEGLLISTDGWSLIQALWAKQTGSSKGDVEKQEDSWFW